MTKMRMSTGEVLIWGFIWLTFLWPLCGGALFLLWTALVAADYSTPLTLTIVIPLWLIAWWLPLMHGLARCRGAESEAKAADAAHRARARADREADEKKASERSEKLPDSTGDKTITEAAEDAK